MNNFFDILKILNSLNTNMSNHAGTNPAFDYYPHENNTQKPLNNDMLPLLMSLLSKNNDLNKVFTNSNTSNIANQTSSSPKDEILL